MVRDRSAGVDRHPARGGVVGVRWPLVLLLALIAIAAIAGIVSTAAMGQTTLSIAIGLVTMAFFSRVGA
ncbi:hypothetical protein [Mycolicibacterium sp. XJ1819]